MTFRGTQAEAVALIRSIPQMLAGIVPDPYGIARGIQLRAGVALLAEIQRAFIQKSRGEVGSDGIRWQSLTQRTIANRRSTAQERKSLGIGKGPRPTLTAAQDRIWRGIYWGMWSKLRSDLGDEEAKRRAAAIAWVKLKAMGAKTKLELLGNRKVDILRDTGELLRSFTPGVEDQPSGADGQVFETPPGAVIVGSSKKPWHHKGDPSRNLPSRPYWPLDDVIPVPWMESVNSAVKTGIAEAITRVVQGGK